MGPKLRLVTPAADSRPPRPRTGTKNTRRRRRLTATSLRTLRSESEPFSLTDPDCRGLLLHVAARLSDGAEGTRSWQWRFRWRGKRVKLTLGTYPETSIAMAHDRVRAARQVLDRGIDPRKSGFQRQRPAPTVGGAEPHSIDVLVDEFYRRLIVPTYKHPEPVKRVLDKEILAHWSGRDARAIKPRDVVELLDGIVDRGRSVMANRVATTLGKMFKFGVHRQIVESSPVQLLVRPGGKERPRSRTLSDEELAALQTHADTVMSRAPRTVATMTLMLYTACRRSEIGLARWSHFQLDTDAPTWRVPPELSKTGVEYIIPLIPEAVAVLRTLKRAAGRAPWVFPSGEADSAGDPKILTRSLARHLKPLAAKGIKPFTLHDLRRTVRSGLARLGIPPHIAERCLNHAQPGVIGVYDVHSYAAEKRAALERWATCASRMARSRSLVASPRTSALRFMPFARRAASSWRRLWRILARRTCG